MPRCLEASQELCVHPPDNPHPSVGPRASRGTRRDAVLAQSDGATKVGVMGTERKSRRGESNPEPAAYKAAALPVELRRQRREFNKVTGSDRTCADGPPADMAPAHIDSGIGTCQLRRGAKTEQMFYRRSHARPVLLASDGRWLARWRGRRIGYMSAPEGSTNEWLDRGRPTGRRLAGDRADSARRGARLPKLGQAMLGGPVRCCRRVRTGDGP